MHHAKCFNRNIPIFPQIPGRVCTLVLFISVSFLWVYLSTTVFFPFLFNLFLVVLFILHVCMLFYVHTIHIHTPPPPPPPPPPSLSPLSPILSPPPPPGSWWVVTHSTSQPCWVSDTAVWAWTSSSPWQPP